MNEKEIATRLREILWRGNYDSSIEALIHELDPPRPEPGMIVWWRVTADDKWHLGCVVDYGIVPADNVNACWNWDVNGLEYKPACILADDEVPVRVPPVSEWPDDGERIEAVVTGPGEDWWFAVVLFRAEAERLEKAK